MFCFAPFCASRTVARVSQWSPACPSPLASATIRQDARKGTTPHHCMRMRSRMLPMRPARLSLTLLLLPPLPLVHASFHTSRWSCLLHGQQQGCRPCQGVATCSRLVRLGEPTPRCSVVLLCARCHVPVPVQELLARQQRKCSHQRPARHKRSFTWLLHQPPKLYCYNHCWRQLESLKTLATAWPVTSHPHRK